MPLRSRGKAQDDRDIDWLLFFARVDLSRVSPSARAIQKRAAAGFILAPAAGGPDGNEAPPLERLQELLRRGLLMLRDGRPVLIPPPDVQKAVQIRIAFIPVPDGITKSYGAREYAIGDVEAIFLIKALDVIAPHWPIKWCEDCGLPFRASSRGDQKYCGVRCSNRFRQQKSREARAQALELIRSGQRSAKKIADAVGARETKWIQKLIRQEVKHGKKA